MNPYKIKLASGRVIDMSGTDPDHAIRRAADLWPSDPPVAWRNPPVTISVLGDARRIIG